MRKYFLLLSFFVAGLFTIHNCKAQTPLFQSYVVDKEVNPTIHTIYEDTIGFLWYGTSDGLYKFNGLEFIRINTPSVLLNDEVTAIAEDHQGRIWIGYLSGALAILENNIIKKFEPEEGTPKRPITGLVVDKEGRIWFSTYGEGLYYYDQIHVYNFGIDDGLKDTAIYAITLDKKGRIWAGTDMGLSICYLQDKKKVVKNITTEDGLPDNIVQALTTDELGNIWIGMYDKGICRYDPKKNTFYIPEIIKSWTFGPVTALEIFDNYDLWIGTSESGVVELVLDDRPSFRHYNESTGFVSNRIEDLLKDEEGNIWIATLTEGLFSVNKKIEYITTYKGKDLNNIQAVLYDSEGILWFSNRDGLYHFDVNDAGERVLEMIDLGIAGNTNLIISIYEDTFGFVWLGTFGNGVFRYNHDNDTYIRYSEADGLSNNNVLSISGKGRELWFATLGGVSKAIIPIDSTDSRIPFQSFSEAQGLGSNYIYYVLIDSRGREWFATDGHGLTKLEKGEFTTYTMKDGLKSEVIYSITEDHKGNIWFSTNNAGIYRYNGKSFINYNLSNGIRDLSIYSLATDIKGNIVIVHKTGIDILNPETGNIVYYGSEFSNENIDPDLNAISKDKSGNIWIGTKLGVLKYTNFMEEMRSQPKTVINKILVFLKEVPKEKHKFSYNNNYFAFDYIGLWYHNPENVLYQHMLEGYDLEWHTSKDRLASYSNLAPGDYKFKVRSSANHNFENAAISTYAFSIAPPFWKHPAFIIFIILLTGGLLYWYIKERESRLREVERLEKDRIEFQFQTLKNQVNPHFLFNSFNTLMNIIDEDKATASKYVEKLSDFFRSILAYREKELITIREELQIIEDYYFLQMQRYDQNFKLTIDVGADKLDDYIPPLTLQLLVENAIKHNIISRAKPLLVEIYTKDGYIVVRNNLQRKKDTEPSTKVGIQNIMNRYKFLTEHPIQMEETDEFYIVKLPIIKRVL